MSVFGDRLRAARLAAYLTQQEAICRVKGPKGHRSHWCHWEKGDNKPRLRDIPAVARAVGVTPEDLGYDSVLMVRMV